MFNYRKPLLLLAVFSGIFSPTALAGAKREVVLDNASVEVVRLTYPAGTESGMHTHIHPNRVVYFVKGGKLELVPAEKNSNLKCSMLLMVIRYSYQQ